MTYPILSIDDFGKQLLETKDIDPVYVLLRRAGLSTVHMARWCLAYWCLYNAGVASYISDQTSPEAYWETLEKAARNTEEAPTRGGSTRWPRGKERRHWRGAQALQSLFELRSRYGEEPETFVMQWFPVGDDPERAPLPFREVSEFVQSHRGFGPWMSFKIADMLEQCFGVPVDFDRAAVFMFKDPTEAALRYWRRSLGLPDGAKPKDQTKAVQAVVDHLLSVFKDYDAPNGHRKVGLQEIETILCKWKSHENGHYPLMNDWGELQHGLEPWVYASPTAERMLRLSVR